MIAQASSPNVLVTILVAIILSMGGVLAAVVTRMNRKKSLPENASILVNAAEVLVGLQTKEVRRIDAEKERLELRIQEVEHEFQRMQAERRDLLEALEAERTAKEELAERVRIVEEENVHLREEVERLKSATNGSNP